MLSGAEEAYYGYLAVVNSTTLADGFAIDMGGGSIQLCRIEERRLRDAESLPLGAVRVSEAFLTDEEASEKQMKKLAKHVAEQVERLGWWGWSPAARGDRRQHPQPRRGRAEEGRLPGLGRAGLHAHA